MKTVNLSKFKTPAGAAKAFHKAVREAATDIGHKPDIEVTLMTPERSARLGYGKVWRVMWEGGPDDWGIKASMGDFGVVAAKWDRSKTDWYMEPWHSFDVGFVGG